MKIFLLAFIFSSLSLTAQAQVIFGCSPNDHVLMNDTYGIKIHNFAKEVDCLKAQQDISHYEVFCTDFGNKLIDSNNQLVEDYDFSGDCQANIVHYSKSMKQRFYCSNQGNGLINKNLGKRVHNFSSKAACQQSLNDVVDYGKFCTDFTNKLLSDSGVLIKDYGRAEDCAANFIF